MGVEDLPYFLDDGEDAPRGRSIAHNLAEEYPESLSYRLKNLLLGKPLVTEELASERLPNSTALGVLAPDCISSSAYGTEEMLTQLTPFVGLAAFSFIVPITVAILGVLFFVTLSYFDVIGYYTKSGGSYVVARENFGPRIAQIAAVALLIDYTVTVAVQTSAGTAALTSAIPSLLPYTVIITVAVVLLLIYGNLRGIREAGKLFAVPTFFYIVALGSVILIGYTKAAMGTLPVLPIPKASLLVDGEFGTSSGTLLTSLLFIQLLRAFANGGSSLTGLEAISNGVSTFRRPESVNAQKTLIVMSSVLGFLVVGTTLLARWVHAVPFAAGSPTVVSQEVEAVLGQGTGGHAFYLVVMFATVFILYTGGNTSFNGFPHLASFVAGDRFLPTQLTKRGHRLAFSNGILVLGAVAIALVLVFRAQVNGLVALYAIGVFTGFTMAGAGMVKHHLTHKENKKWRRGVVINGISGGLSFLVVLIFLIVKFTEGAWIVAVVGPLMYYGLIRMHRQYFVEDAILREEDARSSEDTSHLQAVAIVLVDVYDVATSRAIDYAQTLAECPARRLVRASLELVADLVAGNDTECTILLPRRQFSSRLDFFLHDHSADAIASAVSVVPHVSATIVPFNMKDLQRGKQAKAALAKQAAKQDQPPRERKAKILPVDVLLSERGMGSEPINRVEHQSHAKIAGRITSVRVETDAVASNLECTVTDSSGSIVLVFQGQPRIPGIEPGARIVVEGMVGTWEHELAMVNPSFELISLDSEDEET